MENPAVIVNIKIGRPSLDTDPWHRTVEGAVYYFFIHSILESYDPDIKLEYISTDDLNTEVIIKYNSLELYNKVRAECLEAFPDYTEKRDAYYQSIGGSCKQEVTFL